MESHLGTSLRHHLDLICKQLANTKTQLKGTEDELHETKNELRKTKNELHETKNELHKTKNQLGQTKTELNSKQVQLDLTLIRTRTELNRAQMGIKNLEEGFGNNMFLWKVEKLSRAPEEDDSLGNLTRSSIPFYTGRNGYKLRLMFQWPETRSYQMRFRSRVLLSPGNFSSKNYVVSLVIMKGEYDTILPWPFVNTVTITLIDQQEDPLKRDNLVKRAFPSTNLSIRNRSPNSRPQGEENERRPVMEICPEKLRTRRYVVDDTLFFQVVAERRN